MLTREDLIVRLRGLSVALSRVENVSPTRNAKIRFRRVALLLCYARAYETLCTMPEVKPWRN